MDFDYKKRWPYFLRAAELVGVPECWREDCAQEIAVAVWQAPAGAPFRLVVRSAAVDFMRSGLHVRGYNRSHGGHRQASDHVPEAEPLDVLAEAGTPYRDSSFEQATVDRLDLENAWPLLTARQRRALLLYGIGYRWWEVGKRLGVTETRVCQIGQGARRILAGATRLEPLPL
jgi:DNA-directed RNA polymerase specialized sigma24 family protein